ncbi:MAG: tRNA pseudouridine(38-40) synthase TruA [Bacteroidota bacterium]|nr:tRNA pseudouridine(38-40) synthase TruA [Bacteroidota bacterium]MDP4230994.1 tRNA pseudouridine(38-40) synthase TruA [Bacteroidota bacterium]MDP4235462.1 tRNA pseudouridine(38-40) synthase TruA [Bacteroidota bacterium]
MKIALLLEYDGSDFCGWQIQPGVRTVQQELEAALQLVLQEKIAVTASGRTDAGVHALGMVAHAPLPESATISTERLVQAINGNSGHDLVVRSIKEVSDDFHARYSALDREYRYVIFRRRTALQRKFSWYVWDDLNIEAMERSAAWLIGDHDFTSFSKRSEDVEHYRSIVDRCTFSADGEQIIFTIRANRFVRGMVRSLIGALVEVGRGKLHEEEFSSLLDTPTELHRAKYLAPAEGLTLWKIRYPEKFGLWD